MPGKALMIDLEDNYHILGRAIQGAEDLFYIDYKQNPVVSGPLGSQGAVLAMNAIVCDKVTTVQQNKGSAEA